MRGADGVKIRGADRAETQVDRGNARQEIQASILSGFNRHALFIVFGTQPSDPPLF
jgi:hypothetical protein